MCVCEAQCDVENPLHFEIFLTGLGILFLLALPTTRKYATVPFGSVPDLFRNAIGISTDLLFWLAKYASTMYPKKKIRYLLIYTYKKKTEFDVH